MKSKQGVPSVVPNGSKTTRGLDDSFPLLSLRGAQRRGNLKTLQQVPPPRGAQREPHPVSGAVFSTLHLLSQKPRHGRGELFLRHARGLAALLLQERDAPEHVPLRHDRRRHRQTPAVVALRHGHGAVPALGAVQPARLHQPLQVAADALFQQLAAVHPRHGDHGVAVAHGGGAPGGAAQRFADRPREVRQLPHRGVFFEDHPAVLLGVDLQRVTLADVQRPADLLGDHDAAEIVDAAHDSGSFHQKPTPLHANFLPE